MKKGNYRSFEVIGVIGVITSITPITLFLQRYAFNKEYPEKRIVSLLRVRYF